MKDHRIRPALDYAKQQLAARGFTVRPSGGYRLDGPLPLQASLEREPGVPVEEEPKYNWYVLFGGPHARLASGALDPTDLAFAQDKQRSDPLDYYPVNRTEEIAEFIADFKRLTLGAIDSLTDPSVVVSGPISGRIAHFAEPRDERRGAVFDALRVARAYDLRSFDDAFRATLRAEAARSPDRRGRAALLTEQFGLDRDLGR